MRSEAKTRGCLYFVAVFCLLALNNAASKPYAIEPDPHPELLPSQLAGAVRHSPFYPSEPLLTKSAQETKKAITPPRLIRHYASLPLRFEANQGQTDSEVAFLARRPGHTLFLTSSEAVLALLSPDVPADKSGGSIRGEVGEGKATTQQKSAVVRMKLVDANPSPRITGLDALPGKSNYLIGNDPDKWRTGVSGYARVRYDQVYPGIDLVFHGRQGRLEYDFVLAPGTDPEIIRLGLEGVERLEVDDSGDLVLHVAGGQIRQLKPHVYQEIDGEQRIVDGGYRLMDDRQIGFELAAYDTEKDLIIDPVLSYSTYLGGNGSDDGLGISVDVYGNAYVTGSTTSTDFPLENPFAGDSNFFDAFITKFDATGGIVYSTYLGGDGFDSGRDIAVDALRNAYIVGETASTDFPIQNPIQATLADDPTDPAGGGRDVFITKLDPSGSTLVYSTYLGGNQIDLVRDIALGPAGSVSFGGLTWSADFPTTLGALQGTHTGTPDASGNPTSFDGFVSRITASGDTLLYSTFLGGDGIDNVLGLTVDDAGIFYVTGRTTSSNFPAPFPDSTFRLGPGGANDAYVAKLQTTEEFQLLCAALIGGTGDDRGTAIGTDALGNIYITGRTDSSDFPAVSAAQPIKGGGALDNDAFVAKVNLSCSGLIYSTYLGGSADENVTSAPVIGSITVDRAGSAYVTGVTRSADFPTTANAPQETHGDPLDSEGNPLGNDAFVARLNPAGSALVYSTYLGGAGDESGFDPDIAVDRLGTAYVTGQSGSDDFPQVNAFQPARAGSFDSFVAKLSEPVVFGLPEIVSINTSGEATGNFSSFTPSISANGRFVAFESDAGDLVTNDTNATRDVYVRDLQTGNTKLASVDPSGNASGNGGSLLRSLPNVEFLSADGRYLTFFSNATNLVSGISDVNNATDVFVRDLVEGTTQLVSVASGSPPFSTGAGQSVSQGISADGRFVLFISGANDLDGKVDDLNRFGLSNNDIFVRDLQAGTTSLVSVDTSGKTSGNDVSGASFDTISADGRLVAFSSRATNLVPSVSKPEQHLYVRDLEAGSTMLISVNSGGIIGDGPSFAPTLSADGRFVAFRSQATNLVVEPGLPGFPPLEDTNGALDDIFIRDLQTNTTTLVSINAGKNGTGDRNASQGAGPLLSAGGRFVVFVSNATDLVANDTNNAQDIFIRDLQTNETSLVSIGASGESGNGSSGSPAMSADGRFVAFLSNANDLVPADENTGVNVDTDGTADIYLRDLHFGTTHLLSFNSDGTASGNAESIIPFISADGAVVVFQSEATDLVTIPKGINNTFADVFVVRAPDSDGDGVPDASDNCPATPNPDQADGDGDGIGDACELGPQDTDGDGVLDPFDNCPFTFNPDQTDTDGDGAGDACDADDDNDNVPDSADNCPLDINPDQTDTDKDGIGNACDSDSDNDGVPDVDDNCAFVFNPDQDDLNLTGTGDACEDFDDDDIQDDVDVCPSDPANDFDAFDNVSDGFCVGPGFRFPKVGDQDNCPDRNNPDQANEDGDEFGDVCDAPPSVGTQPACRRNCDTSGTDDSDNDGLSDAAETSAGTDPNNPDSDGDFISDGGLDPDGESGPIVAGPDNCPVLPLGADPDQTDTDRDGMGNVCDDNDDNDIALDPDDNCPLIANDQTNTDFVRETEDPGAALEGDACDDDIDGDGLLNVDEVALGTRVDNGDTDGDLISDGPQDPDGSGPITVQLDEFGNPIGDPTPFGDAHRITFALKEVISNDPTNLVDVTQTWLPEGGPSLTVPGNSVIVVATLRDPSGNPDIFVDPVTFTIAPSNYSGRAINDLETCEGDCKDDLSFSEILDPTEGLTVTAIPDPDNPSSELTVPLYAFDYGATGTITATTMAAGMPASGSISVPLDTDGDFVPDAVEVDPDLAAVGFDPFNAHSFEVDKLDGHADVDLSLDNQNAGDGIINQFEWRGVLLDSPDCDANNTAVEHKRLDPSSKDLFVRGVNFALDVGGTSPINSSCNPSPTDPPLDDVLQFSTVWRPNGPNAPNEPNAFEVVGITVHDVTGMITFSDVIEPPNIDIVVVTNKLDTTDTISGFHNGFIDKCGAYCYAFDTKGDSYIGDDTEYQTGQNPLTGETERGTFTYHLNLMHYLFNRPYRTDLGIGIPDDGVTPPTSTLNGGLGYDDRLDPFPTIEDFVIENGNDVPDRVKGDNEDRFIVNGFVDGDRFVSNWKSKVSYDGSGELCNKDNPFLFRCGRHYSVFDADGDGNVELPIIVIDQYDPSLLNPAGLDSVETHPQRVQVHTILHEICHAIGCRAEHTTDPLDLQYEHSTDWNRGGHIGIVSRGDIYIHNKTE